METSFQAGQWVMSLFVLGWALYFGGKAARAEKASAFWANLALALGLLVFWNPPVAAVMGAGLPRAILGAAGLVCAVVALVRRGGDQGAGVGRCVTGLLLSLVHAAVGVAVLVIPLMLMGAGGDPWRFRSDSDDFSITLPSSDWISRTVPKEAASFASKKFPMKASVYLKRTDEAEYRAAVEAGRRESSLRSPVSAAGTSKAGHPYDFEAGVEEEGKFYVGIAHYWCPERSYRALVLFEGRFRMSSEYGRAAELKLFEETARALCLSLE